MSRRAGIHARLWTVVAVIGLGGFSPHALGASSAVPAVTAIPAGVVAGPADPRSFSRPEPLAQELRHGMESPLVRELQIRLRHAKYLATYDAGTRFDTLTRTAVIRFQRENGLRATGKVDQATWDALLPKSHQPTEAELINTDVGPWFTGPTHPGYMMELQHRLRQVGIYKGSIDGAFSAPAKEAISAYRVKVGLPASEVMDERTWAKLLRSTRNPRYAQLFDAPPASTLTQALDSRCTTGKVVCISKRQKKLSYVVDGKVLFTRDARFSRPGYDSPEGAFRIWYMDSDTVSKIFGERTPMPYAIFYNDNVAIHFSDDFAQKGYDSGSHGCTQLRDYQVAKWLYEQVKIGDRVVVYQ